MQGKETIKGKFSRIYFDEINLDSHDQVKEYLLSVGWVPTEYNRVRDPDGSWRTTSPKLTEDSFDTIEGDTGQLLAKRVVLTHRRRTIKNYKNPEEKGILAQVRADGTIPAEGILCATPTARTTHRNAICNVPGVDALLGKRMRQGFCVKPPYVMLGADLDQIEARITAHYAAIFDGGAYWDILQNVEDIHQYNAELIKSTRSNAKRFQYAIFYGARAPKLASIIGCTVKEAEVHINNFWEGNRGVKDLVDYLEKYYKYYGFIKGLDGRKLFIRAEYKLLNSLIQSAAAIIWKKWGNIANSELRMNKIKCEQIIAYHDEYEYRCNKVDLIVAKEVIKEAALAAGRHFNMFTPITVDVKEGMNWADVH